MYVPISQNNKTTGTVGKINNTDNLFITNDYEKIIDVNSLHNLSNNLQQNVSKFFLMKQPRQSISGRATFGTHM